MSSPFLRPFDLKNGVHYKKVVKDKKMLQTRKNRKRAETERRRSLQIRRIQHTLCI